jgi:catechol 2,3-dioxygenase-like lactoylglutathione lyase family enzyme
MITNISLASVFVKDVDASKAFYIDVLGYEVHTDLSLGDGYRWCTV